MLEIIISTIFIVIAILIFKTKWSRKLTALLSSASFLFISLLSGIFLVADYFTGSGINEAVIFHVIAGLDGAGYKEYSQLLIASIFYLVVVGFITIVIYYLVKSKERSEGIFWKYFAMTLIIVGICIHPASSDIYRLSSYYFINKGNSAPSDYIVSNPKIKNKKNIVYIYLESIERTYFDENLFPGLMPNMEKLEKKALSFTNIWQPYGAAWTIAGMVASQCGIPLVTSSPHSMNGVDQFLPLATCLGDILKQNNYYLSYLAGASLKFQGKGNFYRTHGFDKVRGKNSLSHELSNPDYMSGWGLYDENLFELLKKEYKILSEKHNPFGLFTLNLDTHHPDGIKSKTCEGIVYKDGKNPILNSVHCLDKMVADFIDFIKNTEHADNTLIVINSDHIAHKNTAWDILEKGERRNLFMVIDPSKKLNKKIPKMGTTLDVAPTILALLGAENTDLGFGRNLLSDQKPLIQKKNIFTYLPKQKGFLNKLWDYPQINDNITYNKADETLNIGERTVKTPALFVLDNNSKVKDIIFDFYVFGKKKTLSDRLIKLDYDQSFLWTDKCNKINTLLSIKDSSKESLCMYIGRLGQKNNKFIKLDSSLSLKKDKILKYINNSDISESVKQKRIHSFKTPADS